MIPQIRQVVNIINIPKLSKIIACVRYIKILLPLSRINPYRILFHSCRNHLQFRPFMFQSPSATAYYDMHRYDQLSCKSLPYKDRVAIIIETRDMPVLPWTINNIIYFTHWPVIVYHSNLNSQYLERLDLKQTFLLSSDFAINDYNALLVSRLFWQSLPEHVLLFQTDSFMLRWGLESFLKYDYVGAPWTRKNLNCYSIPLNIGNGGFSLRRRDKMLQIIDGLPFQNEQAEDLYFANGFEKFGGTLPSLWIKKRFSVEHIYYKKPLAVHAPWLSFDENKLGHLFSYTD